MKKIKILLVLFISLFLFSGNVLAASGSLSVSSNNVYVGDTFTVSVKANSMAAWNIHVTATGPVSGCVINQADATADAMDTNKTFTATCKATGEGTITVTLTGDVTSASDGNAVSISGSKSVKVSKKPSPSNTNSNKPSNSNTNTNSNKPSNSNINNNLSKNNNLKELSVEGYNLTKIDNNNYTLTVNNSVTSINVKATAKDSKARITGNGKRDLKVGENTIEVIVTSESGEQKKTTIKVTRKSEYTLDDLNTLLNDSNNKEINIIIDSDTVITSGDISRIKDSKKKVHFNYYEDKNLIYSWIVDGAKVEETNKILTTISYVSDDVKNISKLSNYADGLYANLKNREELPKGTIIKLYVGNKFEDGYVLNLYNYNNNELKLIRDDLNVKSGYVEFSVEKGSEYFISMSNINGEDLTVVKDDSSTNIFMIIAIIEFVIIIVLGFICFKKRKNISKVSNVKEDIKTNVNEEQTIEETIDEDSDDSFDSLE